MNDNDLYQKIQAQVEYYLSDENLKNDKFFHNQIKNSPDGSIPLQLFLNCNKIKKMNISIDKLQKSIEDSHLLTLTEDKSKVKRINTVIPSLRIKRLVLTIDKKKEANSEDDVIFLPYVLTFPVTSDIFFKARDFERKISKAFVIDVPYVKISKKVAVVVFNEKTIDLDAITDFLAQEILIDKIAIKFTQMDESEMHKWFKNNRPYLETALKAKYDYSSFRENNETEEQEIDDNFGPVELASRQFKDFREIKFHLKGILAATRNGDVLGAEALEQVKDLLKYHHRGTEKLADLKDIKVDANPEYPTTRCFFIVKKDEVLEDFSYHKCLKNMYNALIKK